MNGKLGTELRYHMKQRLYELQETIDNHVEQMHTSMTESAKKTLKFIQIMQRNNENIRKRPISTDIVKLDPSMFVVRRLWDQVASADDASSDTKDLNVAFSYQPRNSRSQTTKLAKQNEGEKEKPRITKGEEEKTKARVPRSGEQSNRNSHRSPASPMVKVIVVNAEIDRFKRKTKTKSKNVDGKMVMIAI